MELSLECPVAMVTVLMELLLLSHSTANRTKVYEMFKYVSVVLYAV